MSSETKTRWVIFTASVLSPVDNPDAYLWRALGSRLRQLDHEALFFEPRGNAALRALLERSGSSALTAFRTEHPDIEYRTLEPREGAELVVWMSQILSTADVALIQSTASPDLIEWLSRLTRPHLQTFYVDTGWNENPGRDVPDAEILQSYSAIAVGEERLTGRYASAVAGDVPVRSFGPLPDLDPAGTTGAENPTSLDQATDRLIEIVLEVQARATARRSGLIRPNGHRE